MKNIGEIYRRVYAFNWALFNRWYFLYRIDLLYIIQRPLSICERKNVKNCQERYSNFDWIFVSARQRYTVVCKHTATTTTTTTLIRDEQ